MAANITKIHENSNLTVKARIDKSKVAAIEEVTFTFENWRQVHYELLMPEVTADRTAPALEQVGRRLEGLGRQIFVEFDERSSQTIPRNRFTRGSFRKATKSDRGREAHIARLQEANLTTPPGYTRLARL